MLIFGFDCETTGLSPFQNQVISVQYADEDGDLTLFAGWEYDTEEDLIVDFLTHWTEIKRKRDAEGALFVGYNHLKFDVPFVFTKAITDSAVLDRLDWDEHEVWRQLYRWPMYLDLAHLLGSDFISMRAVRKELLGTEGQLESKRIPGYYESERYDLIERYIRDEMVAMREIYDALERTTFFEELMAFRRRAGHERTLR